MYPIVSVCVRVSYCVLFNKITDLVDLQNKQKIEEKKNDNDNVTKRGKTEKVSSNRKKEAFHRFRDEGKKKHKKNHVESNRKTNNDKT